MGIVRKEFSFDAANGGHSIFACFWMEESMKKYKGIIQIAHGMAEHILRYQDFAVFLAKEGFIVCGNDHSGHGQSVENEKELGYFGEKDGWNFLIQDMNYLMNFMKNRFSNLHYILIGHSMGSFLARRYVYEYGNEINGAVFLGTSGGNPFIDVAIALSQKGIDKKGILKKGNSVYKLAFSAFNFKFIPHKTKFDWISSDESVVEEFINDEKCGFVFTYGGFRDLFQLLKVVNDDIWVAGIPKKLPMLLLSGEEDPVGEYGKGVEKVYKNMKDAGCERVKMKLIESARHEVLNEKENHTVYRYLLRWINEEIFN